MNAYYSGMREPSFCLNTKTGNIMFDDKHIVRFDRTENGIKFWYKLKGGKWIIKGSELEKLKRFLMWMIENHDANFGEEINSFAMS